jgi:hypothetical protein
MKKPQGTGLLRRLVWLAGKSVRVALEAQLQDLQAAADAPHLPQHLPLEQDEQWALLHLA